MNLSARIESLEQTAAADIWEPVELRMYVQDCSIAGQDTPERLSMLMHSGTPTRPGRKYHRADDETEAAFLDRIKAAEAA
jgi:hypothetical protein